MLTATVLLARLTRTHLAMTRERSCIPCFRYQTVIIVVLNIIFATADPQLDLPPLHQSSPSPGTGYGYNPSTQRPINSPGNQYDVHTPGYQYGSFNPGVVNPITGNPGTYSSSTPNYQNRGFNTANGGINPDIINRGYPDQGRAYDQDHVSRNPLFQINNNNNFPTTTDRNYGREDRIDVNNDPNFNRNDPNFLRNSPNYSTSHDEQERRNHQFDERIYQQDIQGIRNFLGQADEQGSKECTNNVAAQWNFETDVNELTQLAALEAQQRYTLFQRSSWETASRVNPSAVRDFSTFRQLRLLSVIGPAALPADQLDRYNRLINDMLAVYNGATICAYEDPLRCGLRLQPDLQNIMGTSRDWEELQHVWTEWRRATGRRIRDLYEQLVVLTNQAAKLNNFTNAADYWTFPYESPTFRSEVDNIWEQVKPIYEMVHAYVRRRHRESFGPERVSRAAPLPAHILGDMWGQSWSALLPHVLPYPGKTLVDVSGEMIQQGYTPLTIFQMAEEFFVSMNMSAMPPDFWALSVLEKPHDRHVHCQPSAWDFCNKHDFRIKMCAHVDMKDLVTAHHEMAHIQYFMQYSQLPKVFRDGANPAFHEAVGEAIALSVGSPRHLQTIGLVQKSVDDTAHDINHLFAQALEKVVFLPFALVMDKWRWDVFSGDIRKEEYNCHWWRLREQYTGVKPPVLRSEQDFDPGSKYHIPANIPYIRYFVSTILQFQLHRALCRASGQYNPDDLSKPLHKCDIYKSPEAGNILKRIMERGSSVPWQQALLDAIGESHLDASALRDYFRPLEEWLRNENLRTNEYIGWTYDGDYCKFSIETAGLQVYGGFYNAASTNFETLSLLSLMLWSAGAAFVLTCRYR